MAEQLPSLSTPRATAMVASPAEQPSLSTTSATAMVASPAEQPSLSTPRATATPAESKEKPSLSTTYAAVEVAVPEVQPSLSPTTASATVAAPVDQPSVSTTSAPATVAAPAEHPSVSTTSADVTAKSPAGQASVATTSAATTAAAPAPAKVIMGKYILGKMLGRGSFAKVYHARLIKTNESVALKVIDKAKTKESMASNIIREIQAMWRLDHPHILKIREVLATKTKIYLVMDLARGGDLAKKLSQRPDRRFPEPIVRKYFEQLVSALYYCHQNGVAHRDIKPQNLLLDEEGNIKLSDFGLSFVTSFNHKELVMKTACGTPCFAAPEIMDRVQKGYDGAKADAWSCGVMLYVLLTGLLPFDCTNMFLMYRKMLRKEFKFPIWVSKPARILITRLLDPNPITRLGIVQLVDSDADPEWLIKAQYYPRSVSVGDMSTLFNEQFRNDSLSRSRSGSSMNAFEIISMSSGLNLSGLFQGMMNKGKKEENFTSKEPKEVVFGKLVESGKKLGYKADTIEDYCVVLSKGRFVVQLVVLEMVPGMSVVEFNVVKRSKLGWDQDELYWQELKSGLAHIVVPWHN